jgi:hypothetical protein
MHRVRDCEHAWCTTDVSVALVAGRWSLVAVRCSLFVVRIAAPSHRVGGIVATAAIISVVGIAAVVAVAIVAAVVKDGPDNFRLS